MCWEGGFEPAAQLRTVINERREPEQSVDPKLPVTKIRSQLTLRAANCRAQAVGTK